MKDVVKTTTLRCEKSKIVIYAIKIKSIFSDINNKRAKMIKKINALKIINKENKVTR